MANPVAGYAAKPLAVKLGIKPGVTLVALGAPRNYRQLLGRLPADVRVATRLTKHADVVHVFARRAADLELLPGLARAIFPSGSLWISWPKKTSGIVTDVSERVVHRLGLAAGLVDVKVAAIDATWSAFKFVYRLRDRG